MNKRMVVSVVFGLSALYDGLLGIFFLFAAPAVFGLSALYDGLLGIFFLFAAPAVFRFYEVTPPNHFGYVHFPAALLIIFGLMFLAIARDPVSNRNLIPYGILLKIAYCSVAFYHWFTAGIPWMWKPFAICDLVFLMLFIWAYGAVKEEG